MQEAVWNQSQDGDCDLAERVTNEGEQDDLGRSVVSLDFRMPGCLIDPQVKAKRRAKNRQARASRKANRR